MVKKAIRELAKVPASITEVPVNFPIKAINKG